MDNDNLITVKSIVNTRKPSAFYAQKIRLLAVQRRENMIAFDKQAKIRRHLPGK